MKRPGGFEPNRLPNPLAAPEKPLQGAVARSAGLASESAPTSDGEAFSDHDAVTAPISLPGVGQEVDDAALTSTRDARRRLKLAERERARAERGERKRFTKRARARRRRILISCGILLGLCAALAAVAFSPLMALKQVQVVGASGPLADEIRSGVEVQLGTPLPLLDLDHVDAVVAKFTIVASYSTRVEAPSTLVVEVHQRVPVAVLRQGAGFRVLDAAGVVLSSSKERPAGLPLVRTASGSEFEAVTAVLVSLPKSLSSQVDALEASSTEGVSLKLSNGKTVLWGGSADAGLKAAVLEGLLKNVGKRVSFFDVSSPNAPVTR